MAHVKFTPKPKAVKIDIDTSRMFSCNQNAIDLYVMGYSAYAIDVENTATGAGALVYIPGIDIDTLKKK